jgi:hypothetical protein
MNQKNALHCEMFPKIFSNLRLSGAMAGSTYFPWSLSSSSPSSMFVGGNAGDTSLVPLSRVSLGFLAAPFG